MRQSGPQRLLGVGVYDAFSAAHLLGVGHARLQRWSRPFRGQEPLLVPMHGWAYSFLDLITLAVIETLAARGLRRSSIRRTMVYCADFVGSDHPFAHERIVESLRTYGDAAFLEGEDVVIDASRSGQLALDEVVRPHLIPVEYGSDHLAALVRPFAGILLHPDVQVGHPCIEGTRVTTDAIADRVLAGEPEDLIADDLGLTIESVLHAVRFERLLDSGTSFLSLEEAAA